MLILCTHVIIVIIININVKLRHTRYNSYYYHCRSYAYMLYVIIFFHVSLMHSCYNTFYNYQYSLFIHELVNKNS